MFLNFHQDFENNANENEVNDANNGENNMENRDLLRNQENLLENILMYRGRSMNDPLADSISDSSISNSERSSNFSSSNF